MILLFGSWVALYKKRSKVDNNAESDGEGVTKLAFI